ncbi:fibronectin-binding protein A, N-terminal domain protein [Peptoniphilus sp. oral taxon 375 str. F0436]|nr:fibronectin-binding protein A, N-terminal domain protein [Peptoniphilus sp. oral taxon 375 str. F0436]
MQPPLFCMVLRKHLQGSKLIQVKQIGQDRIAEFVFEGYNELGDSVKLSLIVEIMGKYSNIILIDTDSRQIIDCLTKVGSSMSSVREVLPGKIYSSDVINQKNPSWTKVTRTLPRPTWNLQKIRLFNNF